MICIHPIDGKSHITCGTCEKLGECGGIHTMLYNDKSLNTIPMPKVKPAKDQLLSAEESRKRADEAVDNDIKKQLQEIATEINAASKEGKYSYSKDDCLKPKIREKLEELGYELEVGSQYNQSWYSISWK